MAGPVDFFYGLGSRYSYLASTQIARLEADTGCRVRWRPLYSAELFAARGADPFHGRRSRASTTGPGARFDAECWADYYGVPFREPEDVRFEPRRLALAATAAGGPGAVEPFSRRLFQAVFVDGSSPLDDAVCRPRSRSEVGLDPSRFARRSTSPETAARLAATVADALAAGVFGVPSFVVDGQVYFGNDRLPIVRHDCFREAIAAGHSTMHTQRLDWWQHEHVFGQDQVKSGERRTLLVVLLTAVMMVVEIAAGLAFGSMALLADGLHMASHATALGISVFAYVYARRLAGHPRYSFGTGKVNGLAGFASAVLLVIFAAAMAWESAARLIDPIPIALDQALVVATAGLLVNGASAWILAARGIAATAITTTTSIMAIVTITICAPLICTSWPTP